MNKKNLFLSIVLLIHANLLFYDFFNLPFTHDELSAIYRCRFNYLNDLIHQGVRVDGHPAAIQLMMWFIIQQFGINEWILKLPFLLSGLISTYFFYKISIKLFSFEAAVLNSLFIITLFNFLYLQGLARPYSIGLMLNLALFYHVLKLQSNATFFQYLTLIAISTLSYYVHYFSFLQSIVIWVLGSIYLYKYTINKTYLSAFLISILLFLPHINITLHQLSLGGLNWLQKPDIQFFINYYFELFNSSLVLSCLAFVIFVLSLFHFKDHISKYLLLLGLTLMPLLVLTFYSIFRAPVLQSAALCFSTPFLILIFGNALKNFNNKLTLTCILVVFLVSLYSLKYNAYYFSKRTYQPIKSFISFSTEQKKIVPNTLIIWQGNSNYFKIYQKLLNVKLDVLFAEHLNELDTSILKQYDEILTNHLSSEMMRTIQTVFPFVKSRSYHLLFESLIFTKNNDETFYTSDSSFMLKTFNKNEWSSNQILIIQDITKDRSQIIEFHLEPKTSNDSLELIVETIFNSNFKKHHSIQSAKNNILTYKIKDIMNESEFQQHPTLKIYLQNKKLFKTDSFRIRMTKRPDNPYEYTGNWD